MTLLGWLQIGLMLLAVLVAVKPLGLYMARVFEGEPTFLSPVFGPVERGFYALSGVDRHKEQGWLGYTLATLAFSIAGFVILYGILRLQGILPLNPQGFAGVTPDLAFNIAVSFVTNTNWQSYVGETTMSNFSQMTGLAVQNFLSGAVGMALAVALTRGFIRSNAPTVGNFRVDVTRATLYVLLPLAVIVAFAFIAMGLPQTLAGSIDATTLEGARQTIALGPVASQEAIKQLGTNGGGFFNTNAAHPFENPNILSNFLNIFSMLVITSALVYTFGEMVKSRRQGWALLSVIAILLVSGVGLIYWAETCGNPILAGLGIDPAMGNMEGKEVRFGQAATALYAGVTTGISDGGVNAMHGSRRPGAAFPDRARRDPAGRRRLGSLCADRLLRPRRLRRRPDGGAHAGVPRQEDRGARDEICGARRHHPAALHSRLHRGRGSPAGGAFLDRQSRSAWPQRDPLRLLLGDRQ
jgi:K+-transporting ATPase ATPase A chain